MDESKPHFDSALGGLHVLPNMYHVPTFLKQRMEEVVMLTEAMNESPFRGQTFQRLPKHMRRRQMSHYIKRLPRRLQRPYLLTLKDGLPEPSKFPSRKYRRRPQNLLQEYNRRQRVRIWLETHIWHAKRFHMTDKWGYKLPESPTNKSFRACYRAMSEHCLLTDMSYYNCIELKGSEGKLLEGLKQCTSANCGLTFGAKLFLNGAKEGTVTFYHPNSYPYNMIGTVRFIWKKPGEGDESRVIWIWVHPLIHEEIVECLKTLFNLNVLKLPKLETVKHTDALEECQKSDVMANEKKKKKNRVSKKKIEQVKLLPKNIPTSRTPQYTNDCKSVTLTLLKDTLNRFRLTGPLSQAIISEAFDLIPVHSKKEIKNLSNNMCDADEVHMTEFKSKKRKLSEVEIIDESSKKVKIEQNVSECATDEEKMNWWVKYYQVQDSKMSWQNQKKFYEKLSGCYKPTDVPPGLILPIVISDPRIKVPQKRQKAVPVAKDFFQIAENSYDSSLHESPIWNPNVRDEVSMRKLTTEEINDARSKKIVPGYDVDDVILDEKQPRIPIILVQRPGVTDNTSGRLGLGSGWDIISPAGYGMPIWRALIFRGARSGGLRETELMQLECSNLDESHQPDSRAGKAHSHFLFKDLTLQHFKLPPNKRPNYIKLGVPSPFRCPWDLLVTEWMKKTRDPDGGSTPHQGLCVLRDIKLLQELHRVVADLNIDDLHRLIQITGENCLVPVMLVCSGKGTLKDLAMICVPKEEDCKSPPIEPVHEDLNEKSRKMLKNEHGKVLKSLRRRRRKDRSRLKENFINGSPGELIWEDILKSNSAPSDKYSEEYKAKMEALWVPGPEELGSFVDFSSRSIIGFLVKGSFTYSKSICTGLGYVTILGLIEVFKVHKGNNKKFNVLVRNRDELKYRTAILHVNKESSTV